MACLRSSRLALSKSRPAVASFWGGSSFSHVIPDPAAATPRRSSSSASASSRRPVALARVAPAIGHSCSDLPRAGCKADAVAGPSARRSRGPAARTHSGIAATRPRDGGQVNRSRRCGRPFGVWYDRNRRRRGLGGWSGCPSGPCQGDPETGFDGGSGAHCSSGARRAAGVSGSCARPLVAIQRAGAKAHGPVSLCATAAFEGLKGVVLIRLAPPDSCLGRRASA